MTGVGVGGRRLETKDQKHPKDGEGYLRGDREQQPTSRAQRKWIADSARAGAVLIQMSKTPLPTHVWQRERHLPFRFSATYKFIKLPCNLVYFQILSLAFISFLNFGLGFPTACPT